MVVNGFFYYLRIMPQNIVDNGFIFFKRTLPDVYAAMGEPQGSNIKNYGFVCPAPMDEIRQISNYGNPSDPNDTGLNFAQDYTASLVDCCDNFLLDITPNFTIYQFNQSATGYFNMYWQLKNVGQSFHKPVHIRITQTTQPTNIAYSSPFVIKDDPDNTTMVDYWDYSLYDGFDYGVMNGGRCRIRIKGRYTKPTPASENQTYTQVSRNSPNGVVVHNRGTKVMNYNWVVEYGTNFGLEAFESMRGSAIVYLNGVRATNIVQSTEDVLGTSNFHKAAWVVNLYRTETYENTGAIGIPFALVLSAVVPFGSVTLATLATTTMKGYFTKDISIGTGRLVVIDKASNINVLTYTASDITLLGTNGFEIASFAGAITNPSDYYIIFDPTLFPSLIGEVYNVAVDEWHFTSLTQGQYKDTQYTNNQYIV